MVLDSSAIIAIELKEPGFERLIDRIGEAKAVIIGVPTMFETVMVLSRRRGQRRSSLASRFSPERQSRSRYFHGGAPGRGH